MSTSAKPVFQNSKGVAKIEIGDKEFVCIGANPPFDHPHIYIDMGASNEAICPYCSTLYAFNPRLHGQDQDATFKASV